MSTYAIWMIPVLAILASLYGPTRVRLAPTVIERRMVVAWTALIVILVHDFGPGRSALAVATEGASRQNLVELFVSSSVAVFAGAELLKRNPPVRPTVLFVFLLYPAVAIASSVWSVLPAVSAARGSQAAALGIFGLLVYVIERERPGTASHLLTHLAVLVLAFAVLGVLSGAQASGRATWPSVHPGVAANLTSLSLLAVLGAPGRRFTPHQRVGIGAALLVFLLLTQTRSAIAATAIGVAVLAWYTARRGKVAVRRLAVIAAGTAGVLTVRANLDAATTLVARGENPDNLGQLNGRRELFEFIIQRVGADGRGLLGYGYNASRTQLVDGVVWGPGTAHNSLFQAYADLGLVGAAVFVLVMMAIIRTVLTALPEQRQLGMAMVGSLLAISVASEAIALPTVEFGVLLIVFAMAAAHPRKQSALTGFNDGVINSPATPRAIER